MNSMKPSILDWALLLQMGKLNPELFVVILRPAEYERLERRYAHPAVESDK